MTAKRLARTSLLFASIFFALISVLTTAEDPSQGALGEEIDGILYYPKDYQPGKKYPLLTAPHGGPAGADLDSWEES